jgi:hypothetical protein
MEKNNEFFRKKSTCTMQSGVPLFLVMSINE